MHDPTGEITLRAARSSDAPRIGVVGYSAWRKRIGVHVSPEAYARCDTDIFASSAQASSQQTIVAECCGATVGFAATEDGDNYISDLWVAPDFEGRGTGTAPLSALERAIAERGYETAQVEVLAEHHRALTLFRRPGYKTVWEGTRQNEVLVVALLMRCLTSHCEARLTTRQDNPVKAARNSSNGL